MRETAQAGAEATDVVQVHLVGLPVDLHVRAREHSRDLQREFALIHHGHHGRQASDEVPTRLLELVEQLRSRFGAFAEGPYAEIDEASRRGEDRIDVTFTVPRAVGPAAVALRAMLDEADEFCRQGQLLTLATPDRLALYRRWFLAEFVRQAADEPPVPWEEFEEGSR